MHFECDNIIEKYGGKLRVPYMSNNLFIRDFPGIYTTIITKYNIDKIQLYGIDNNDACVIILSKTLLLQNNYHINVRDAFGVVNPIFTYFPWELDKLIQAQKRFHSFGAIEQFFGYNETIFHNDIDLHKYCCKIVPMIEFKKELVDFNTAVTFDYSPKWWHYIFKKNKNSTIKPSYDDEIIYNRYPTTKYDTSTCIKGAPNDIYKPMYYISHNIKNNWNVKVNNEFSNAIAENDIKALKIFTTDPANIFCKIKDDLIFIYIILHMYKHISIIPSCKDTYNKIIELYNIYAPGQNRDNYNTHIITMLYEKLKPSIDALYACVDATSSDETHTISPIKAYRIDQLSYIIKGGKQKKHQTRRRRSYRRDTRKRRSRII